MGQREDIVKAAVSQLGYKEGFNNSAIYGKWYGMDNNPWCAMFVSWCANKANISYEIIPRFAYVPTGVKFFKNKNEFQYRGKYTPRPGDIIFFGSESHVGIVEKVADGYVYTIEGNTSANGNSSNGDGVYRRKRKLTDSWILGYGVPAYKEDKVDIKKQDIYVDGKKETMNTIFYENENYLRLRDIAPALGFEVKWDEKTKKITVVKAK